MRCYAGSGCRSTAPEERQEKAEEVKEEVEKGTTSVHGDALPVRFGPPGLGDPLCSSAALARRLSHLPARGERMIDWELEALASQPVKLGCAITATAAPPAAAPPSGPGSGPGGTGQASVAGS